MRARGVWLGIAATVLVASALPAWSMELRDMPAWLREMIEPVHVTTPDGGASGETAGVHVWGTQGAIGGPAVAPQEAVSPPGAIAAPATGPVSLSGMGAPPLGGVRAPSAGDIAAAGVTLSPMAAEWDTAVASIEGLAQEDLALAGRIVSMLQETQMTEEEFILWAEQNHAGPGALSAAYHMLSREKPYWNEEARVACAALANVVVPLPEHIQQIPPEGLPGLALHFALTEQSAAASLVLDQLLATDATWQGPDPLYVIGSVLLHGGHSPDVAISAWRTGARRSNSTDLAHVCFPLHVLYAQSGDRTRISEELVPWCIEAIEGCSDREQAAPAVAALTWAYSRVGRLDDAIETAIGYLEEVRRPSSVHQWRVVLELIDALSCANHLEHAEEMRRLVASDGPTWAAAIALQPGTLRARAVSGMRIPRPCFYGVSPDTIDLTAIVDTKRTVCVIVEGNPAFRPVGTETNVAVHGHSAKVHALSAGNSGARWLIEFEVVCRDVGPREGSLFIITNDADNHRVVVPLRLHVEPAGECEVATGAQSNKPSD